MKHVLFARFHDNERAAAAIRMIQGRARSGPEMVAHIGAVGPGEFEQVVQHSGVAVETDVRHALVVGVAAGGTTGAALGAALAAVDLFPGTLGHGAMFGAIMVLLVGLLMMSIFGSGLMDGRLRRLTQDLRRGDVVLTVRAANREDCDMARAACVEHGADVAEKGVT
jgi:hypothetical protein